MTTTSIEWTDKTWNPVTGCVEVSPGCDRCYARTFAERWRGIPGHPYQAGFDVTLRPERLGQPASWTSPARVFVNSMSDLFHEQVPDEYLARVFATMAATPRHTYQVLTKRHARMRAVLANGGQRLIEAAVDEATAQALYEAEWPLPNVWLGVSAEDQHWADIRIPVLLDTPAAVRFVSCEPLLGPIELGEWLRPVPGCRHAHPLDGLCAHPQAVTPECHRYADCPASPDAYHGLDWLIVGGESGPGARPMDLAWVEALVAVAESVSLPIFVKQLGTAWSRAHGGPAKGGDPAAWPQQLRVRQFPDHNQPEGLLYEQAYRLLTEGVAAAEARALAARLLNRRLYAHHHDAPDLGQLVVYVVDEAPLLGGEMVWIATGRRGVEYHRLADPGATACHRSTRTGQIRYRAVVSALYGARPCPRCFPGARP